jgi:hypothetical protein
VIRERDEVEAGERCCRGNGVGCAAAVRASGVQVQGAGRDARFAGIRRQRDPRRWKKEKDCRGRGEPSNPETN